MMGNMILWQNHLNKNKINLSQNQKIQNIYVRLEWNSGIVV